MKAFNPVEDVEDSRLVLDHGHWPNFYDAEVHHDVYLFQGAGRCPARYGCMSLSETGGVYLCAACSWSCK